jgi:hypothetical protein
MKPDRLELALPAGEVALYGEAVKRRLEALGRALERPVSFAAIGGARSGGR